MIFCPSDICNVEFNITPFVSFTVCASSPITLFIADCRFENAIPFTSATVSTVPANAK